MNAFCLKLEIKNRLAPNKIRNKFLNQTLLYLSQNIYFTKCNTTLLDKLLFFLFVNRFLFDK